MRGGQQPKDEGGDERPSDRGGDEGTNENGGVPRRCTTGIHPRGNRRARGRVGAG